MANILTEGFDWLPSSSIPAALQRARYYTSGSLAGSAQFTRLTGNFPTNPGLALQIGSGGSGSSLVLYMPFRGFVTPNEVYAGFRFEFPGGDETPYIALYNGAAGGFQMGISFHAFGLIKVWRGQPGSGVVLATSRIGSWVNNSYCFVEFHATIASSGAVVEVRVNTKTVLLLSSANTKALTSGVCDSIAIGGYAALSSFWGAAVWDDIYVNDTTGSTNNGFLGNVRVNTQFAIANGDHIGFSIGGTAPPANNWQAVLNTAGDNTKYTVGASGQYDLYQANPIINGNYVFGVQVRASLQLTDATQLTANARIKTGGVEYTGTLDWLPDSTTDHYYDFWEVNPGTGVAFTVAEANALQMGVRIQ